MKHYIFFIILTLLSLKSFSCSMFKITENGKAIVGNNEDWVSLNSKIWFEPADKNHYGAAYLGFIDDFPQGPMNTARPKVSYIHFEYFTDTFLCAESFILCQ